MRQQGHLFWNVFLLLTSPQISSAQDSEDDIGAEILNTPPPISTADTTPNLTTVYNNEDPTLHRDALGDEFANILFNSQTLDGDTENACERTNSSFNVLITALPTQTACFNLNDTITRWPEMMYQERTGVNYMILYADSAVYGGELGSAGNGSLFDPVFPYTAVNIFQTHSRRPADVMNNTSTSGDRNWGALDIRMYNGLDCLQVGDDETGEMRPWLGWNCGLEGGGSLGDGCDELEFGVRSFSVGVVEESAWRGDGECVVAAEYGNAAAGRRAGVGFAMLVAVGVSAVVVMGL